MGGRSSKNSSRRSFSSSYEHDSSRSYGYPPPSPYPQPSYQTQLTYTPHHPRHAPSASPSPSPSPRSYAPPPPSNSRPKKTLERKYLQIADNYRTLDEKFIHDRFDDNIPSRAFDNFQFVNFTHIMSKKVNTSIKEAEFALLALMEIPSQYLATLELGILGHTTGRCPVRVPLHPPRCNAHCGRSGTKSYSRSSSIQQSPPTYPQPATRVGTTSSSTTAYNGPTSSTASSSTSAYENQTCCDCGEFLDACPICRRSIETRIRLY